MNDRLFYPLMALITAAVIALAAVWPQGLGDRSPGPFGHVPQQQTPQFKAALAKEQARAALADAEASAANAKADLEAAQARAQAKSDAAAGK